MTVGMNKRSALWLSFLVCILSPGLSQATKPSAPGDAAVAQCTVETTASAYSFKVKNVDGQAIDLAQYKGKVSLIVNTASKCGYTGQYKDLQGLYEKYKAKGFVVLGFPSNDFGGQEPGTNQEIKSFCAVNFKVNFPLFAKAAVTGTNKQPLYHFLTQSGGGEVDWNFEKFLVDQRGVVVGRFKSKVGPMESELTQKIEAVLATAPPSNCSKE